MLAFFDNKLQRFGSKLCEFRIEANIPRQQQLQLDKKKVESERD